MAWPMQLDVFEELAERQAPENRFEEEINE
jgi:hypothetical protein